MSSDETNVRKSSRKKLKITAESSTTEKIQRRRNWLPKAGGLAQLLNMPLDIIFEIFGHLRPLDILNLARTSKDFRRLLMCRSSISIWKAARANIEGFPDCPPEMSEPQWAHLAFYPHCNICLTPGIRSVDWRLRIRICSKCAKDHIDEVPYGLFGLSHSSVSPRSLVLSRPGKRGRLAYLLDDYWNLKAQYDAIQDPEGCREFLAEKRKTLNEMEKHASICEKWASTQAEGRSQELRKLKLNRKKDIIERLTALGWGEEIAKIPYLDDLGNHRLVKVPQQLTARIWKNIHQPLVKYMELMKSRRLVREFTELRSTRKRIAINILRTYKISQLPFKSVMPEPNDFCRFPIIEAIIEQSADVVVDDSSFADIVPRLPRIIEDWRASINQKLVEKMRKHESETWLPWGKVEEDHNRPIDIVADQLKLATTVFNCVNCVTNGSFYHGPFDDFFDPDDDFDYDGFPFFDDEDYDHGHHKSIKPLFYPSVLGHRCLTKPKVWRQRTTNDPSVMFEILPSYRQQWSCDYLEVDQPTGSIVQHLVEVAGLDPSTTTASDLDQLDPRFACLLCVRKDEENLGMGWTTISGWRAAVKHHLKEHYQSSKGLYKLTEAEIEETSRAAADEFSPGPPEDVWLCMHCYDLPTETEPMILHFVKAHLLTTHEIHNPVLNQDYAKDFTEPQLNETANPYKTYPARLKLPWP